MDRDDTSTDSAPLVDIGVNLAHDSFDPDRAQVIARAVAAGVTRMIVTGSSGPSSHRALELARSNPGVLFATCGMHPHHASDLNQSLLDEYEALARDPQVVAIGECGLDYFRDFSPRDVQRDAFHRQLELAEKAKKPLFLHVRDAHEDFVAILREHPKALAHGGVAHCFTGDGPQLDACLALGLSIGITGWICDERRGAHLLPLMSRIPRGCLLLETDAPYLLPRDLPVKPGSRRNEPLYLPHIAHVVARARAEPQGALAAHTTQTANQLFKLDDPG
jgi:TatD DNase family protein